MIVQSGNGLLYLNYPSFHLLLPVPNRVELPACQGMSVISTPEQSKRKQAFWGEGIKYKNGRKSKITDSCICT